MEEEQYGFDDIEEEAGSIASKKKSMERLNKKKLTKWEMDDLFCDFS
ncbi:MAG: hypothetical protein ABIH41_04610 [Nanoarchaeota archaeon]